MRGWRNLVQATKYQIYISRSRDPFLNLSIEHFLLQKTPPESTILFLYVNKPCIVIGRNQNPWLEVNLRLVNQSAGVSESQIRNNVEEKGLQNPVPLNDVQLVRRRSGGGAVFHDEGNLNYSVICPSADFTRDKHAEMVTKTIRLFNRRARVNERHDIVLDPPRRQHEQDPIPTNTPLKVSGSAYKITRQRSLHHGTCLLASPNLANISRYLQSPARPFLKARGVESVRSPIANVFQDSPDSSDSINDMFKLGVVDMFREMYGISEQAMHVFRDDYSVGNDDRHQFISNCDSAWAAGFIGEDLRAEAEIHEGVQELKSSKWLFNQTPQFTLSSHPNKEDDRERPPLPSGFPSSARVYIKARAGAITESKISISSDETSAQEEARRLDQLLRDRNIHEIDNFREVFARAGLPNKSSDVSQVSQWLNVMFGKRY